MTKIIGKKTSFKELYNGAMSGWMRLTKAASNCASENLRTDARAFNFIRMRSSSDKQKISASVSEYVFSSEARNPVFWPSCSTMMSDFGPPELWATTTIPAAMHSTTPVVLLLRRSCLDFFVVVVFKIKACGLMISILVIEKYACLTYHHD